MYLDFMTPTVWDALVVVVTLAGLSLAGLRLVRDRAAYRQRPPRREFHARHDQQ